MGRDYGISEIARELGVSRQRIHQKVKKCQNPYIKYKPTGRPHRPPVIAGMVAFPGWVCPDCQTAHRLHPKKTKERKSGLVFCLGCKKSYHLTLDESPLDLKKMKINDNR